MRTFKSSETPPIGRRFLLVMRASMGADAAIECGSVSTMARLRKITVEVPADLLEKAQEASGAGIAQTVRIGLQLVAVSRTYARLRQFRGKVRFSRSLGELKSDRPY